MLSIQTGFVINLIDNRKSFKKILDNNNNKKYNKKNIVNIVDPAYDNLREKDQGNNNVNRRT